MFAVGVMDAEPGAWDAEKHSVNASTEENIVTARNLSAQSTVLLKNNGVLPLKGSFFLFSFIYFFFSQGVSQDCSDRLGR